MNVRAIAFDLDDTLLRDDRTVSDYTVSVLRRAAAQGIHVIPASGRAQHSMEYVVDALDCASLYIACNGAELWSPSHQLLRRVTMSMEISREIIRFAEEYDCNAQIYRDNSFYHSRQGKWAQRYEVSSLLSGVYVPDLASFITGPQYKILMSDEPQKIAVMLQDALSRFGSRVNVACSKPYFLEFNPLEAGKGNGLRACGELLGFDVRDAVAFGDSLNDLSMLEAAGTGIVMANGRPDVLQRIPVHCGHNEEDGVAHYIEAHYL